MVKQRIWDDVRIRLASPPLTYSAVNGRECRSAMAIVHTETLATANIEDASGAFQPTHFSHDKTAKCFCPISLGIDVRLPRYSVEEKGGERCGSLGLIHPI